MLTMLFQPRTLQQRTLLFILVPTLLLLISLSVGGFIFVRNILLNQWGETAVAQLQRTAHLIDMELREPKELLQLLLSTEDVDASRQIFTHILQQIRELDGVVRVNVEWLSKDLPQKPGPTMAVKAPMGMMHGAHLDRVSIGTPTYNKQLNDRTVSLIAEVKDVDATRVGTVEVVISFEKLIDQILKAPWWKSSKAYLVDSAGNVLASTALQLGLEDQYPMRAFGTVSVLEEETLAAMQAGEYGTVFGPGSPPEEISGFYHLTEAPWTIVIMTPGENVLQPIIRFNLYYFLTFAGCILLILIVIRQTTNPLTKRIKEVSAAAEDLARGKFGPPLAITTRDEVGELTRSFNKMTWQLEHRLAMKEAINIAREVQQNLLPDNSFSAEGVMAVGTSLYCDETGGDYFDILTFPDNDRKVGVVVGDVVGHGIGAALLMTTVRALFRCRLFLPGRLDEIMNDVNQLLWLDTNKAGSFVTLFYLEIDRLQKTMRWIRGGHDPAIIYSPASREFSELKGNGVALGIDAAWRFEYNELPVADSEQLILIGSDGAWEAKNAAGEEFGKERLRRLLRENSDLPPDEILKTIVAKITEFRGKAPQHDDITLVVVKTF